jgi:hypothetical protein
MRISIRFTSLDFSSFQPIKQISMKQLYLSVLALVGMVTYGQEVMAKKYKI